MESNTTTEQLPAIFTLPEKPEAVSKILLWASEWKETVRWMRGWVETPLGDSFQPSMAIYPTRIIIGYIYADYLIQAVIQEGKILLQEKKSEFKLAFRRYYDEDEEYDDTLFQYWEQSINHSLAHPYDLLPLPPTRQNR